MPDKLHTRTEKITPAMAKRYLEKNAQNRNLRMSLAEKYGRAMSNGEWMMTGEAIKFDTNGALADGQHRLMGVTLADVAVEMLVVRGVQAEAQTAMDTGAGRKLSDVLKMNGEKNASRISGALRSLWYFKTTDSMIKPKTNPTNQEMLAILETHPNIRYAVGLGQHVQSNIQNFNSSCTASLYLMLCVDYFEAEEFAIGVRTGIDLPAGDPRLALRKTLMRTAAAIHKPSPHFNGAWFTKAWNRWRSGESADYLHWKPNAGERWPWPNGLDEHWYSRPLKLPAKVGPIYEPKDY